MKVIMLPPFFSTMSGLVHPLRKLGSSRIRNKIFMNHHKVPNAMVQQFNFHISDVSGPWSASFTSIFLMFQGHVPPVSLSYNSDVSGPWSTSFTFIFLMFQGHGLPVSLSYFWCFRAMVHQFHFHISDVSGPWSASFTFIFLMFQGHGLLVSLSYFWCFRAMVQQFHFHISDVSGPWSTSFTLIYFRCSWAMIHQFYFHVSWSFRPWVCQFHSQFYDVCGTCSSSFTPMFLDVSGRWWCSTRFSIAIMGLLALLCMNAMRVSMAVAIVCMVNHTAIEKQRELKENGGSPNMSFSPAAEDDCPVISVDTVNFSRQVSY